MLLYKERRSGKVKAEKIYGKTSLSLLYSHNFLSRLLCTLVCRFPLFSSLYARAQKSPSSKRKILPFINAYEVDATEFLEPVHAFGSFNDFFIRKLKPSCRLIDPREDRAILPADGRFRILQQPGTVRVKEKLFTLVELLDSAELAKEYEGGSIIMGRLAPVDYHRFHFPCDCTPSEARVINGPLFSVNPLTLKNNFSRLAENKRALTLLDTPLFGKIAYIEVGATNVGSIHQTFTPYKKYLKGEEKGYFSFGGSALLLLFQKDKIIWEDDLLANSKENIETLCQMGTSMGKNFFKNCSRL